MVVGLLVAAVVPTIVAGLIGYSILGLRGHYFAICTLGLGVAAGEISGGIEIIGAGQGFTTPPFPDVGSLDSRGEFFYFLSFFVLVLTFITVRGIYTTRFKLILNAIRDNEDKAEAMGIETMKYKIIGWMISAFFCGLAGGIMGGLVGYIDSTDVAFDGREMGVFMVLMAILGGKGTLWGPIIGATVFHIFKEGFWTFFLGWQYVALGVLIVVIVIYFPEGIMGWLREKYPERFGEVVDEKDRKAQVELK
jgi:branched-chain amino acid transport system permease protein